MKIRFSKPILPSVDTLYIPCSSCGAILGISHASFDFCFACDEKKNKERLFPSSSEWSKYHSYLEEIGYGYDLSSLSPSQAKDHWESLQNEIDNVYKDLYNK